MIHNVIGLNFISALCCMLGTTSGERVQKGHSIPVKALPNILIVTADDLAYNSVGAFGCQVPAITPNIDRLAGEGIRFMNAHTNVAVSMPCRQSWMTGCFPHNTNSEGFEPIDENVHTLTELLKGLGYLNGILGKEIHHQPVEKYFWDFIPFKTELDSQWRKGNSRNPELFNKYSTKFFKMAKDQDRPFFLIANSHDPHRPFVGSKSDTATWGANMPPVTRIFAPEEVEMLGYLPDIKNVRKEVAQYYGSVYRCDQNIGAVLDALRESGQENNTLIIFLSDHGAAFPFSKSQCYLNSSKTPLIVKWPGNITPGSVDSTNFVMGIDLMPTIMEIAGLPMLTRIDGRSFLPLLQNKKQQDREFAYTAYYQIFAKKRYPMRCVQNEQYGYIYNFWSDHQMEISGDATGGLTWKAMIAAAATDAEIARRVELYKYRVPEEFYNFKKDPNGLVNLINDPSYAGEVDRFRRKMKKMMKKYRDPAYEAFRDRKDPGVIAEFMKAQREKAKNTRPVQKF
jgi:N-sulfoglucosamine sulfohydrolase